MADKCTDSLPTPEQHGPARDSAQPRLISVIKSLGAPFHPRPSDEVDVLVCVPTGPLFADDVDQQPAIVANALLETVPDLCRSQRASHHPLRLHDPRAAHVLEFSANTGVRGCVEANNVSRHRGGSSERPRHRNMFC